MYAKNGGLSRKLKLLNFLFGFYSTFFFIILKTIEHNLSLRKDGEEKTSK